LCFLVGIKETSRDRGPLSGQAKYMSTKSRNPKTAKPPNPEVEALAAGRGRAPTRKRQREAGRPARTDSHERLLINIAGDLKRRLAHRAIEERTTMGKLIERALEDYLEG